MNTNKMLRASVVVTLLAAPLVFAAPSPGHASPANDRGTLNRHLSLAAPDSRAFHTADREPGGGEGGPTRFAERDGDGGGEGGPTMHT